jgi:hypothetical protein
MEGEALTCYGHSGTDNIYQELLQAPSQAAE